MSRGGSYGGGQSSLGYLFGSEKEQPDASPATTAKTAVLPPYGVDSPPENFADSKGKMQKNVAVSNNYHRSQGQNSGNFITERPTTKVRSVPGGNSSLGYLFEDK